jgi:hypothetical protein
MGDTSDKKKASSDLETQLAAELEKSLFGDLSAPLADDDKVIPVPSKPKTRPRPAKPKNYDEIWRETAAENINAAADTLAAIKDSERRNWLARLLEAIEKRLGPESLGHMKTLIQERQRKGKW